MNIIKYKKTEYVSCDDIMSEAPIYSRSCRNTRDIIKKRAIPKDDYIFVRLNKETNKWEKTSGKSIKYDKVFIKKDYLSNIPELNGEDNITDEKGIQQAPPIIQLTDEEKFQDNDGNVLEIETRGTRKCDNIYFKVKDVEKGFGIKNLYTTIIDKRWKYTVDTDYKYFICKKKDNLQKKTNKQLFLTYVGILRVMFVSRSGNCQKFIKWATETLFTIQMGTKEQKEDLVSGLIGIPAKSLRQVLSKSTNNVPCIYRFALGTCKSLRKKMKIPKDIPDNSIIIKYGYTDNLKRRTKEHMKTYESIKGVNLELMNYVYVDPKYLSQAETDIKEFFEDIEIPVKYKNFVELVAINPKHEKQIKKQFKYMASEYVGNVKHLIDKIEELKREAQITKERHESELLLKDKENEFHIIIPYHNSISPYHKTIPHHYPHHNTTSLSYITTLYHHSISPYHITIPYHHSISPYHITIPYHYPSF